MRVLVTGRGLDVRRERRVGNFELDQAKALRAAGHEVRFAALDTRSVRRLRSWGSGTYELEGIRVFACTFPVGNPTPRVGELATAAAAQRLWRRVTADGWRPDVIHSHFGGAYAPIARREGIPLVYTEHFSGRNRLLPAAQAQKLAKEYDRASCLLAVSGALAENIRRNTGIRARVVPNIVDVETFRPVRKEHTGFRFVTAGNLVPIKGLDTLLRAFALSGVESRELCIFGDGPERSALEALSGELGIRERVQFRGACPRTALAEEYASSDCYVLSSLSETFGLSCAEAMAAGLPVIATACGGPEDFVGEENGLLVPVGDAQALAAAMDAMAARKAEYDAQSISHMVEERFSPSVIAETLTGIYRELI